MLLKSQVTLKTIEKIRAKILFKKKKKASMCMVTGTTGSASPISTIYFFLMIIGLVYQLYSKQDLAISVYCPT